MNTNPRLANPVSPSGQRHASDMHAVKTTAPAIPRVAPREFYPVSLAQRRLWFLNELVPNNAFYNMPAALRLRGMLDIKALSAAVNQVVSRHDSLRSTFINVGGEPAQVIAPQLELEVVLVDLSSLSGDEKKANLRCYIDREATTPFDLVQGPLLRVRLLRLNEIEHVVLVTMHHIISDGWSLGVFVRELASIYAAITVEAPVVLPELPVRYVDFAAWQETVISKEEQTRQLAYWADRLRNAPPILDLVTDFRRPPVPSFQGRKKSFRIGADLTQQLRNLAKRERATLFMVLASAFNLLLHRYTNQEDILIGLPIAARNCVEVEPLIGFFANTLVLRTDLSGRPSFRELLARVRVTAMEAFEHQDTPFERIVDMLKIERDMSYTPLFQVCLALQPRMAAELDFGELESEPYDIDTGTAKFDLWLSFIESSVGLQGAIEYATDLFNEATIDRLIERFCRVLTRTVTDPDAPIDSLPLISESEQRQLLVSAALPLRTNVSNASLHARFEQMVAQHPECNAVSCAGTSLTYGQLNRRANRLARHLIQVGVAPGDLVGLYAHRCTDLVVAILAILKTGAAYLPLDPVYPTQRLAYMLADAQSSVLVLAGVSEETVPDFGVKTVNLDEIRENLESVDDTNLDRLVEPDSLAYVIYTSGSTGQPKGCLVTHGNVLRLFTETQCWYDFAHDDIWTLFHSHAFDFSVWEIWGALLYGGRLVVVPYVISREPEQFYKLLQSEGVTVLNQTPSAFQQLMRVEERSIGRLERLRHVIFGGEALEFEALRPWFERHGDERPRLINMYGITETTVHVTFRVITKSDVEHRIGSVIGVPIPDLRIFVLDGQLKPVPLGVPGEIFVEGAGLAKGYLRRPELTHQRFVTIHLLGQERRLYRTGDRARYLSNGELEYLGRVDSQVKIRGFRIELGEIETELLRHPAIADARVLARSSSVDSRHLVAYVVPCSNIQEHTESGEASLQVEQTKEWANVFDTTYSLDVSGDPTLNIAGWKSSYTGTLLPLSEMHEWVERTVERVLSFAPTRILEIGVGTGMLLLRLAPRCQSYIGTDLSGKALERVSVVLTQLGSTYANTRLLQQEANVFSTLSGSLFDTVVINSVLQYFPSAEYLVDVIRGAMEVLAPGGRIFLGDIRNLNLVRAFQCSVDLSSAKDTATSAEMLRRVARNIELDTELTLTPRFFLGLPKSIASIQHVEIRHKRAVHHNEMSCYRFDVILHKSGVQTPVAPDKQIEFSADCPLRAVERVLLEEQPQSLLVQNVPNARVAQAIRVLRRAEQEPTLPVRELRRVSHDDGCEVDPEHFWRLAEKANYQVEVIASSCGSEGCFDVVFKRDGSPVFWTAHRSEDQSRDGGSDASKPLMSRVRTRLVSELRAQLRKVLPDYMVPSAFVLVDSFPLTPNGKLDANALPTPALDRGDLEVSYVAPTSALEVRLASLWSQVLGLESIGINDSFFELGGHSLLATQLFFRVHEVLGVKLPLQSLFLNPTISGMAAAIGSLAAGASSNLHIAKTSELAGDTLLDESLRPRPNASATRKGPILLTGATGFFGAFLLAKLIRHRSDTIFCLVRSEMPGEGMARIRANLRRFGLEEHWNEDRVVAVPGDLARPFFGLGSSGFESLANQVCSILHNGATVNFVYPYSALRAPNVQGTHEIIRLATTGTLKPIHFISTLHVFASHSDDAPSTITEEMVPSLERLPNLGYTQSKLVCELLLLEAKRRGVPVAIYRPGRIGGDFQSGVSQQADFLWRFLKGCVQMGHYPDVDFPVDLIPADYLAEAIVTIASARPPSTTSRDIYHFSSSEPLSFNAAISAMQSKGLALVPLSYSEWVGRLLAGSRDGQGNVLYSLLPLFAQEGTMLQAPPIAFGQDCTSRLVTELGLPIPPTDRPLFERYVDHMLLSGFFPVPN